MEHSGPEKSLLRELQRDCSISLATLAERCGMSQSTVWRKIQEFEATGLLRARVALLDPAKLGPKLAVLASVSLEDHSEAAIDTFTRLVSEHPEIMECHAVSGSADYILKVRVADVEAYERFMTVTLLRNPVVRAVQSSFVLREIKSTTELPI
ncbi:MAG: Lrp/AsnC family transcriptional regulator [Pseudomonadota bacterium]